MRRPSFLIRLGREGKLQEVEPSEEIKKAYLQRSDESLSSAKALLKIGNLKDSVALAYYSMYHCLLAALFRIGIKCENHAAAILMLKEVFGMDNKEISKAKKERVDKQYYVDFEVNKDEVEGAIRSAEVFISGMDSLIAKLNEDDVGKLHEKAAALFKEDV
jgi:uncharacterized protein (UPF0332 family)